jgi:hypothetical protein
MRQGQRGNCVGKDIYLDWTQNYFISHLLSLSRVERKSSLLSLSMEPPPLPQSSIIKASKFMKLMIKDETWQLLEQEATKRYGSRMKWKLGFELGT